MVSRVAVVLGCLVAGAAAVPVSAAHAQVILSRGAEPRKLFRFRVPVGHSETTSTYTAVTMKLPNGMPVPGMPPMRIRTRMRVTAHRPNGDIVCETTILKADAVHTNSTVVLLPGTLKAILSKMVGTRTTDVLTPAGKTRSTGPPGAPQPLNAARNASNFTLLPKSRVGVGARWRRSFTTPGAPGISHTITYTLTSIHGSRLHLRFHSTQRTSNAKTTGAATNNKMSATGTGTMVIDLHRLSPVRFTFNTSGSMTEDNVTVLTTGTISTTSTVDATSSP